MTTKDPESASGLLLSDGEDDGTKLLPSNGIPPGACRIFMASSALASAFACGALAVALMMRPAPVQTPTSQPLPSPSSLLEENAWMEHPGLVDMPSKRDLGDLLKAIKDVYPDGSVWKHVKYLDIDHKDPDNLKYDYNMRVFKNTTRSPAPHRKLQDADPADLADVGKLDVMRQMLWAICGIDAAQILSSIGQITTNIRTVTIACKKPYPLDGNQQDFCAGMVGLNLAIWGYIAIYIEDMVSSCGPTFNIDAGCSLDMTGFLANGALVAAAGANMKQSCVPKNGYWEERLAKIEDAITADTLTSGERRFGIFSNEQLELINKEIRETAAELRKQRNRERSDSSGGRGFRRLAEELEELATLPADPAASAQEDFGDEFRDIQKGATKALAQVAAASGPDDKEFINAKAKAAAERMGLSYDEYKGYKKDATERTWKRVACGFDLSKAVARLAQMATLIAMAVKDCGAYNFEVNGHQGKTKCAIDVTGAIASAGIAASMITISVINCPATLEYSTAMGERLCAAAIIDLVTATTYIGTSVASVQSTCGSLDQYPGVPGT